MQKVHVATTGGEELADNIGRAFGLDLGTFVLRDQKGGTRSASSALLPSQTYWVDVLSSSRTPAVGVDGDGALGECPAPEPTADVQMEGGEPDTPHTEELEKQEAFPRRHERVGGRKALQDPDTQRLWQALTLKMYLDGTRSVKPASSGRPPHADHDTEEFSIVGLLLSRSDLDHFIQTSPLGMQERNYRRSLEAAPPDHVVALLAALSHHLQ